MFDTVFRGLMELLGAFQQVMLLGIGLICLGIGGIILFSGIQARLQGLRVSAVIAGVRQSGVYYYPVYRYTHPATGEEIEVTANSASNIMKGKETGRQVTLLVSPGNPQAVTTASPFFLFGALALGLPGGVMAYLGATLYPLNAASFVALATVCLYGGAKLRKYIIPKDKRLTPGQWKAQRLAARNAKLATSPVTPIEEIAARPEMAARRQLQAKSAKISAPLLLVAGLAMMGGGAYMAQKLEALLAIGLYAPGRVVDLSVESDSDGSTYHAIVAFSDAARRSWQFRDKIGTYPASHDVGDDVTVLYDQNNPEKSAIIDRGWKNWIPAAGLGLFGAILLLAGFSQLGSLRQSERL